MEQDETMQRLQESHRRLQQPSSHNKSIVSPRRELRQRLFEPAAPTTTATSISSIIPLPHPRLQDEPLSLVVRNETPRVPSHPAVSGTYEKTPSYMMEHLLATSSTRNHQNHQNHRNHQNHQTASSKHHHQGGQQRNYKNMTRERRIEANARERTRVHTISAAFDTLRRAIPAYSHNQKLSKLSVLRIACSYIMTLSKILQENDSEVMTTRNNGPADLDGCVELVSRTIQTEGKLRKRKDDWTNPGLNINNIQGNRKYTDNELCYEYKSREDFAPHTLVKRFVFYSRCHSIWGKGKGYLDLI